MGSSGTPEIVANLIEGFAGKPYRVVAPIRFLLAQLGEFRTPENVIITDWLPALEVNRMADAAVIHGGVGTVMTAALAGKPVVGVGMQIEQKANLACLERLGFAIRVGKSRNPSKQVQAALAKLLDSETAKAKAAQFAQTIAHWDGPRIAAEVLLERYGGDRRFERVAQGLSEHRNDRSGSRRWTSSSTTTPNARPRATFWG